MQCRCERRYRADVVGGDGVEVRRLDTASLSADREYDLVMPRATYSTRNKDRIFMEIYALVQASTLVDEYRWFELWRLVEQNAKSQTGDLIEIGV